MGGKNQNGERIAAYEKSKIYVQMRQQFFSSESHDLDLSKEIEEFEGRSKENIER